MKVSLRYVHEYRDRHGKVRRYFRRPNQKKIALLGEPGSAEFIAEWHAAMSGQEPRPVGMDRSAPGSVGSAVAEYYQHALFLALAPSTRKMRRAILERFRAEHGDKRIAKLGRERVSKILGKMRPFAQRNWRKALHGLMEFCVETGLRDDDPTEAVKLVKVKSTGFTAWNEAEIALYRERWALGTRERLTIELLASTGAARCDVVLLGPQHVRNGWISFRRKKTGVPVEIPVLPEMQEAIDAMPARQGLAFLLTGYGKPYSAAGFGNWFRECCDAAGITLSAHGVRKYAATNHANHGATAHELMAWFGWLTMKEAQDYTRTAERRLLARRAADRLQTRIPG